MVSVITRLLGFENIEVAEDIVQETMLKASSYWAYHGLPANPEAWLYTSAKNKAIDYLRREKNTNKVKSEFGELLKSEYTLSSTVSNVFLDSEIEDSQLRMIFACCHPKLKENYSIALTLKVLSGFGNKEIARALLTSPETINKRITRAKNKIKQENISLAVPIGEQIKERLPSVLKIIYLMFNEGYNSLSESDPIKKDLCFEAMRLCKLIVEHKETLSEYQSNESKLLLALMCFHSARFDSRLIDGKIISLDKQDRSKWDKDLINIGLSYLQKSEEYESKYFYEANIAVLHSSSLSYEDTNWELITENYKQLVIIAGSPTVHFNYCIALAEAGRGEVGLDFLRRYSGEKTYDYYASQTYLLKKLLRNDELKISLNFAIDKAPSQREKDFLIENYSQYI